MEIVGYEVAEAGNPKVMREARGFSHVRFTGGEKMKNTNIIEICKKAKEGRRYIKGILHEIYPMETMWNKNGITWLEEYTKENMNSAIGMPLCCQFIDDDEKDVPLGHGEVDIKDGKIIFEDSLVVGSITNVYIDTVNITDNNNIEKTIRALVYEGFIYEQRFPMFTRWLIENAFDKKPIASSVEIMAKDGNEEIIYRDGWKKEGRIPKEYAYSGHAILSVSPADDSSVVLEINNALKSNKTDLNNKENKEENIMAEVNKETILELKNKIEEKTNEINSLNTSIKEKDEKINELNSTIEEKEVSIKNAEEKKVELETELNSVKEDLTKKDGTIKEMETELNSLREFKKKADDKALINELNEKLSVYTDEEKAVVNEKVELFTKEPVKEKIGEIISEINAFISKKVLENRKVKAEQNANNQEEKVEDIYGDVIEVNAEDNVSVEDLY